MPLRPRSAWEAIDLGILLARRQARLLAISWALLTLPVFGLLSLVFWQHPTLSLLLFWWFKPLYERLPLFILSHALFADTPSLRRSMTALPGLLRRQWLASVTWRRFSLTRSFELPVLQLEALSGSARQQRLLVLKQRDASAARWLTIVGVHLESGLWLGALALIYMMTPAQLLADWNWQELMQAEGDWLWFEHLTNLAYVLVLVIWEPIYVACGFSLYLNRRTVLEAWDIELSFRRLVERLRPALPALLLGIGLLLVLPSEKAHAAPGTVPNHAQQTPAEPSPSHERLLNQPLTSQAASARIAEVLDQPPFRHRETITRWRFGDEQPTREPGWLTRLLSNLLQNSRLQQSLERLATGVEIALWAALFGLITLTLWRYRAWLSLYVGRRPSLATQPRQGGPSMVFGLDTQPESLPQDVASEAERLWDEQPGEALRLLYRAFLSRLREEHRLGLKAAHTEGDVLVLLRHEGQPELIRYAESLTHHWLNLAYGQRLPPSAARRELCDRWREVFVGRGCA